MSLPLVLEIRGTRKEPSKTRMHSSRMRTVRSSGRISGGGGGVVPYLVGGCTWFGSVYLVPGGVPGPVGVPGLGGYLVWGVPGPGECTWSWGGVHGCGGCIWPGGCTWSWGVYLVPGGVPGPGGVPAQVLPPC